MEVLGFHFFRADADQLAKPETSPNDKFEYYSFIFCYVDYILCIHNDPDDVFNKLNLYVQLKPGSFGSPNIYLGTKLKMMQLYNGIWALPMSQFK